MVKTREWPTIAEGQKLASQRLERTSDLQAPRRPPNPSRFRFEQVNEVTWKLTNGGDHRNASLAWSVGKLPNDKSACVGDLRRAEEVVRRAPQVVGAIWRHGERAVVATQSQSCSDGDG